MTWISVARVICITASLRQRAGGATAPGLPPLQVLCRWRWCSKQASSLNIELLLHQGSAPAVSFRSVKFYFKASFGWSDLDRALCSYDCSYEVCGIAIPAPFSSLTLKFSQPEAAAPRTAPKTPKLGTHLTRKGRFHHFRAHPRLPEHFDPNGQFEPHQQISRRGCPQSDFPVNPSQTTTSPLPLLRPSRCLSPSLPRRCRRFPLRAR